MNKIPYTKYFKNGKIILFFNFILMIFSVTNFNEFWNPPFRQLFVLLQNEMVLGCVYLKDYSSLKYWSFWKNIIYCIACFDFLKMGICNLHCIDIASLTLHCIELSKTSHASYLRVTGLSKSNPIINNKPLLNYFCS